MPVSSYIPIQGTSVIVVPYYVEVDSPPPPAPPANLGLFESFLTGGLPASAQAALKRPLDVLLNAGWKEIVRPIAIAQVEQGIADAIKAAGFPAAAISVSLPDQGSLAAQANTLSAGATIRTFFPATIPADTPADFLDLLFSLPSPSASISWFDAVSFEVTFDGAVELVVIVPHDPSYPMFLSATMQATNIGLNATDLGGALVQAGASIASFFTGQPLTNAFSPPDQYQPISLGSLPGDLAAGVAAAVDAFTTLPRYGFVELSVRVNESPLPAAFLGGPETGATVEFDLVHPFDPPPVVSNAWADPGARFALATLQLAPSAVAAGDQLGVSGSGFPPGQATQLEISWTDTCSGTVTQSELQWGENLGLTSPPVVPDPEDLPITRNGPDDGQNSYTASGLAPSTVYAFRVRDFDVSFVATQWSDWLAITTQSTEDLQLILNYEDFETAPLGTVPLAPADGTFSTTVQIPDGLQSGTYMVQAVLADVVLAQAPLSVVAAGQVPQTLEIYDPNTGLPATGAVTVFGDASLYLRGEGFKPGGQVELYVDNAEGISLGTAFVRAWPRGSFLATITWPAVSYGPHQILAVEAALTATAPVWYSGTAQ